MQLLTDVHLPLLELVVEEAFEAAIDVAGQENLDVRLHEMRYASPPLKVLASKSRTLCAKIQCRLVVYSHLRHAQVTPDDCCPFCQTSSFACLHTTLPVSICTAS